jgi:membrane protein
MLRALRVPVGWVEIFKRAGNEMVTDNCLSLAASLAYYFFLALFPALLFLVALMSFFPAQGLLDSVTGTLGRLLPGEGMKIIQDQIIKIAGDQNGGLLTFGMLGTIWSTSSGMTAIIDSLNQAYDIQEGRPWWKVRLTAIGLTIALAVFIVLSTALVIVGPTLAQKVAEWFHLGLAFKWTWLVLQWPLVVALVSLGIALVYYFAPDAEQDWIWITPGSVVATLLWLIVSLGFKFYVTNFGSYNATYGAIGGVIVLLLWMYVSSLAILFGAEMNAEIEHASPYGKEPGEKTAGEKKKIGALAEREWNARKELGTLEPVFAATNCPIDAELPAAVPAFARQPRPSDWVLSGLVLGEIAVLAYVKLRARFERVKV